MERKLEPLELIFKEYLHGKYARVSSGSLMCQGTMEQKCKMIVGNFNWLELHVPIKYNNVEVTKILREQLLAKRNNSELSISFDNFNAMEKHASDILNEMYVQAGVLHSINVSKFETVMFKDVLHGVNITYNDGTIVRIYGISDKSI